jgi:uncharacterized protein
VEILEVKRTLAGGVLTFPCAAVEMTPSRAVLFYRSRKRRRIGRLHLPPDTITLAYFWADRPYNVYHWLSPSGDTLGWYFNLSSPARIVDARVEWDDLEVDVLVTPPALETEVLDEDVLPSTLTAPQRDAIAAARRRVFRDYAAVVGELSAASAGFLATAPEAW